jgi:hypothetical protein
VHRDTLMGRCAPTTGITPFADLVTKVMTREPYASARRVCWIVDNGSSHRGHASVDRMAKAWPTANLVHLPVHASWLSQVEIYFSIVQRKVLTTNDFLDMADVVARRRSRITTTSSPSPSTGSRARKRHGYWLAQSSESGDQPLTSMASSFGRSRLASWLPGTPGLPGAICIKEEQR